MTRNKILGTMLMLILPCIMLSQTFESLTSVRRTRGMSEDQGRIVLFGNGLTWINPAGDIVEELALIDGMTISDIRDVTVDGLGGLWVLTATELGHLSADRKIKPVFHISTFEKSEARKLKLLPDGTLLVLLRNKIIEVKRDLTYSLKYQSPDPDIGYFNVFDVDQKGNIYIGSFFRIYILEADQPLKIIDIPRHNNIQRIEVTEEQRIIVLEYKNVFELVDGKIITLLAMDQLSRGIKFYEGDFKNMQDYWLYANEGNAFHFHGGKWKNYTPPPGIKTGNLGESILRTSNGNLWMGLGSAFLLRFDGTKWHNLTLKEIASASKPFYVQTLQDGTIYASEQNTTFALTYNGTDFTRIAGLPAERLFNVKKDPQGNWTWTTEKGIFNYRNGRVNNLVALSASVPYEFFGDAILFADEHKLKIFKDGKTAIVDESQHHLGWDEIYGIQLFRMFDNKICAISSTHQGLISCYDGKSWEKIISIEGKMIGSVFNMHTLGDKTYIVTNAGAVALYDANGWRWIHQEPISQRKLTRSFLTLDDFVWYVHDGSILRCIGPDKIMRSFEIPIKDANYGLDGIIHIAANSYLLFTNTGLIRMELPGQ